MKIYSDTNYIPTNSIQSKAFCDAFIHSDKPKYIFGINSYADSIASLIDIDGYIDEFATDKKYKGKPIYKPSEISQSAMVVGSNIGKPLLVKNKIKRFSFWYLDYFSFFRDSGLDLKPVLFWSGFKEDFLTNREQYEEIFSMLEDDVSKNTMESIINFRLTYDLDFMQGFTEREDEQYFEDFLTLKTDGECFADVGGFDGFTTKEFVRHCQGYDRVYFFEPEHQNMLVAKRNLENYKNIDYYEIGLASTQGEARFNIGGSSSKIDRNGSLVIKTGKLDQLLDGKVTFIKMDIEGEELNALMGARETIRKNHPTLAISVYHRPNDLWKIPGFILSITANYKIFIRHYTSGISETVMFFVPK